MPPKEMRLLREKAAEHLGEGFLNPIAETEFDVVWTGFLGGGRQFIRITAIKPTGKFMVDVFNASSYNHRTMTFDTIEEAIAYIKLVLA